jgi:hypothetical protein
MPLSVPLGPGDSTGYTIHVERVRWDAAELAQHGSDSVKALRAAARESLRSGLHCFAATLLEADVEVIEQSDGSAEAVARVLCDSDVCAAAAEQYEGNSDAESEAARKWPFSNLVYQIVGLHQLRGEPRRP